MLRIIILAVALPLCFPCLAGEIRVPSRLASVTVFLQGAGLERIAEIDLQAGVHTIIVDDLPASAVANSIRVDGTASGQINVGSVDTRLISIASPGAEGALAENERKRIEGEIQKLQDQRAALDGEIEAAAAQKTLAENLARLPAAWLKPGSADNAPMTAADWPTLFGLIGGKMAEINTAILAAKVRQRAIDEQIKPLQAQLDREPPAETERMEAVITVEAAEAVKARLAIHYQVPDARWTPVYDARLATGEKGAQPLLVINRGAVVSQETGEDWTAVALSLSTARPGEGTRAPELVPLKASFRLDPRPLAGIGYSQGSRGEAQTMAPSAADKADADDVRRKVPAALSSANLEASAFQAVFRIQGAASVKSGAGARKVHIASDSVKPNLKVVASPGERAAAYLHAAFTHNSAAPYLPGKVALYRDGVYSGTASIPLMPAGEEQEIGFGVDDAIKITRVPVRRAKGETGIISTTNVDEQHYKITVRNLHDREAPLLVLDQMPFAEDEQILVELLPITTQAAEINYDDKRGVVAWTFTLKPGEERDLAFSYQISWPAKKDIVFTPRR